MHVAVAQALTSGADAAAGKDKADADGEVIVRRAELKRVASEVETRGAHETAKLIMGLMENFGPSSPEHLSRPGLCIAHAGKVAQTVKPSTRRHRWAIQLRRAAAVPVRRSDGSMPRGRLACAVCCMTLNALDQTRVTLPLWYR